MRLFTLFCIIGIVSACKKTGSVDMEFEYYPIVKGKYIIYKVKEIHTDINSLTPHDTLNYFVKAKIGDTVTDNEGRLANRYERYYSNSAAGPWAIHDVWTTIMDNNRAELIEENNRVIKLVFKPTDSKEWNCNAFNILDPLTCYYTNIGSGSSMNGLSFSSTIQVEQENELNFIQYKRKYEKYAKNVGMIYKHYRDLEITNQNPSNVKKGTELFMEIVDYGME